MRRFRYSSSIGSWGALAAVSAIVGTLACSDSPISPESDLVRVEAPTEGQVVASEVVVRTEYRDANADRAQIQEFSGRFEGRVSGGRLVLMGTLSANDVDSPLSISVLRSRPTEARSEELTDAEGVKWLIERDVDASGTRVTVRASREGELSSVVRYRFSRGDGGRLLSARAEYFVNGSRTQSVDMTLGALHRDLRGEELAVVVSLLRRLGGWTADALLPREAHAASAESLCMWLALAALGAAAGAAGTCVGAAAGTAGTGGAGAAAGAWACAKAAFAALGAYLIWEDTCAAQK